MPRYGNSRVSCPLPEAGLKWRVTEEDVELLNTAGHRMAPGAVTQGAAGGQCRCFLGACRRQHHGQRPDGARPAPPREEGPAGRRGLSRGGAALLAPCRPDSRGDVFVHTAPNGLTRDPAKNSDRGIFNLIARLL